MKIFTEFTVLYPDQPMPVEERFCPSFWEGEDVEAEGNYYFEGIDGRWTDLELSNKVDGQLLSTLTVHSHRSEGPFDSSHEKALDLQRYLDYHTEGRYQNEPPQDWKNLAVTTLIFETISEADYKEFLGTVQDFLEATGGITVNTNVWMDAEAFRKSFLPTAT